MRNKITRNNNNTNQQFIFYSYIYFLVILLLMLFLFFGYNKLMVPCYSTTTTKTTTCVVLIKDINRNSSAIWIQHVSRVVECFHCVYVHLVFVFVSSYFSCSCFFFVFCFLKKWIETWIIADRKLLFRFCCAQRTNQEKQTTL